MSPRRLLLALLIATSTLAAAAHAAAVGTAFTYQGRIDRNNFPANDTYSLILRLYDAATLGTQVGASQTLNGVIATNGLFSVTVDFGAGVFTNQARWLDVQVKGSADAAYTPMGARQPITPVPFALYALNGGTGGSQWVSDGPDLTYPTGGVGFTGGSSPFASGKGVFIEGGNVTNGNVFAFNYDTFTPLTLALNAPGGNVSIGVATPAAKLDVLGTAGLGIKSTVRGSAFITENAAIRGIGNNGGVTDPAPANGVWGSSNGGYGVYGTSVSSIGVYGLSSTNDGVWGYSTGPFKSGVVGLCNTSTGQGGYFRNDGGGTAMYIDGLAKIKTVQILGGADLAERFEAPDGTEPGTVMVIDASAPGRIRVSDRAYARTVAGVVSGANGLAAGVELAKDEKREGTVALALTGRVWVKCDAAHGAIHAGDLLTSADRAGFAMVAKDRDQSQGAILGKAMTSLEHGTGLVLVLVSLQ